MNTKKRVLALVCLVAMLGVLAAAGVMAQGARARAAGTEKHPAMMRALRALNVAKVALQKADHDFGGHRAKALALTNQAIEEVKAGLASDAN